MQEASLEKLATCAMDLQILIKEVDTYFPCQVLEGHRRQAAQDEAFAEGASKLKWPHGKHNAVPSNAVDVAYLPIDFKDVNRFHYFAGFVLATAIKLKEEGKMLHSIRWGGNWLNDNDKTRDGLADLVHFELIPIKES